MIKLLLLLQTGIGWKKFFVKKNCMCSVIILHIFVDYMHVLQVSSVDECYGWNGFLSQATLWPGTAIQPIALLDSSKMSNRTIHHKPSLRTANIAANRVQYYYSVIRSIVLILGIHFNWSLFFLASKLMKFSRCFFIFVSIRNFSIINIMRILCTEQNLRSWNWCDELIDKT